MARPQLRNPPTKAPVENPPLPIKKRIGSCVPNEEERRERQGEEGKGKEEKKKENYGEVVRRSREGKRERYEVQGCCVFFIVFFTKRREINQS